jgi:V8-like Glu-specific endopeptidase
MPDFRRLLGRAERSFGGQPPDRVIQRVRAIIGSEAAMPPTEEGRRAVEALRKLKKGDEPSPPELAALELFIRMTRPAPLVRNGKPDDLPRAEHLDAFRDWKLFQQSFSNHASSVGRVDRAGALARSECVGTCFQIDDDRVLTNRHVLDHLSRGTMRLDKGMGVVRFQKEFGVFAADKPVAITGVDRVHPKLDAAVLRIERRALSQALPWQKPAPREDTDVVVVGYPAEDSSNNPLFIEQIYQNRYEVLRAAPGMIVEKHKDGFQHDCSTLQGNSGSPVLDLKTCRVVGLHTGGGFLWSNEAAAGKSLRDFVGQ